MTPPPPPATRAAPWLVRGDLDGFFGLALDNLVQLLLIDTLCRFVLGFPPDLVYGRVLPGAMPWSHRWIGNPLFSLLVRVFFRSRINDAYCGLRGFSKSFYDRLNLRCTGMEFAIEMLVKASLACAKMSEVPITLHPDGRVTHPPHLRTIRDGWRNARDGRTSPRCRTGSTRCP